MMGSRIGVGLLAAMGVLVSGGSAFGDVTFASSWTADSSNTVGLTSGPNFPVTGTSGGTFATSSFVVRAIFDGPTSFLQPMGFIYFGDINDDFLLLQVDLSEDGTTFTPVLLSPLVLGTGVANSSFGFDVSGLNTSLRDEVEEIRVRIQLDTTAGSYVELMGVSNPEPATITLFAVGLGAASFAGYRRRRKLKAAARK